jgi:hypothetical protein
MVEVVPIQREFQTANPQISDPNAATTPVLANIKRKRTVVPVTPHPTTGGGPVDNLDQQVTDPDTGLPVPGSNGEQQGDEQGGALPPGTAPGARTNGASTTPVEASPGGSGLRNSPPSTTPSTTQSTRSPEDELVTVKVCSDSGDLVNGIWCPAYVLKKVTRATALHMHKCRLHHAPPGERE